MENFYFPGDQLTPPVGRATKQNSRGIYECDGNFYSSLSTKYSKSCETSLVPKASDRVICQVLRISSKQATVQILSSESHCFYPLNYRGIIRQQDIRDVDRDKALVYKSFRPGDIVVAEILGVGESNQGFLLSTANQTLGVIVAKSIQSGGLMVPIGLDQMQCPVTKFIEPRKCARV